MTKQSNKKTSERKINLTKLDKYWIILLEELRWGNEPQENLRSVGCIMLWGHFAKETHYLRSLQDNMKDNVDTTGCFQPGDDTKQTWNKVVANSKHVERPF